MSGKDTDPTLVTVRWFDEYKGEKITVTKHHWFGVYVTQIHIYIYIYMLQKNTRAMLPTTLTSNKDFRDRYGFETKELTQNNRVVFYDVTRFGHIARISDQNTNLACNPLFYFQLSKQNEQSQQWNVNSIV